MTKCSWGKSQYAKDTRDRQLLQYSFSNTEMSLKLVINPIKNI